MSNRYRQQAGSSKGASAATTVGAWFARDDDMTANQSLPETP
jgi:hypothetical protein